MKYYLITIAYVSLGCFIAALAALCLTYPQISADAKFEAMCEKKGLVGIKTLTGNNMCVEAIYQEKP